MWHQVHQDLLERYASRFSLPGLHADDARAWTKRLAEQFAYTFPTQGWGTKRADPGRPPSTDVICTRIPFLGYDVIVHQGAPGQQLASFPHADDLTGQIYIGVVPANHVGPGVPPVPAPAVKPYPGDLYFIERVGMPLEADYTLGGQRLNAGAATWFARTIFDAVAGTLTMEASVAKHREEWRAALGLPPLS